MWVDLPDKPHVSHQSLSKALDAVPIQWNPREVKETHVCRLDNGIQCHKIFMDEFGVNVWTATKVKLYILFS